MIPAKGSYSGVVLDDRWTHGTFTAKDNASTWDLPFVGWTTEVVWNTDLPPDHNERTAFGRATYETEVVPLFWDAETQSAMTVTEQRHLTGIDADLTKLHPRLTDRAGDPSQRSPHPSARTTT